MNQAFAADEVQTLKDEVKQLRQDLGAVTESLKKVIRIGAKAGEAQAQEELDRLYEQFREKYDSVRREGSRVKTGIEREIEERPLTTLIGALIVGMILGKFVSAR